MKRTRSLLRARIGEILSACDLVDSLDGYSYRFDLSTSAKEFKVNIYHHEKGESYKRLVHYATLQFDDADVMEDFKELEIKLYEIATKKASVVNADY